MTKEEFKSLSTWDMVRTLSGIVPLSGDDKEDVSLLTSRLALICLISRVEAGDATREFLDGILDKVFAFEDEGEEAEEE